MKDATMRFAFAQETRTVFDLVMQFLVAGFAFGGWHICGAEIYRIFQSCCPEVGSVSQIWLKVALEASPVARNMHRGSYWSLAEITGPNHALAVTPKFQAQVTAQQSLVDYYRGHAMRLRLAK